MLPSPDIWLGHQVQMCVTSATYMRMFLQDCFLSIRLLCMTSDHVIRHDRGSSSCRSNLFLQVLLLSVCVRCAISDRVIRRHSRSGSARNRMYRFSGWHRRATCAEFISKRHVRFCIGTCVEKSRVAACAIQPFMIFVPSALMVGADPWRTCTMMLSQLQSFCIRI